MIRCVVLLSAASLVHAMCLDTGNQVDCVLDARCLWSPHWAPNLCTEDPCRVQASQDACEATSVEMPVPCQNPVGNEAFCTINACVYNALTTTRCTVNPCMHFDKVTCEQDTSNRCKWNTWQSDSSIALLPLSQQMSYCNADYCVVLQTQPECEENGCDWFNGGCRLSDCGQHDLSCNHDLRCSWNLTQHRCQATPCGITSSQSSCSDRKDCMWNVQQYVCVKKTCDKYNGPPDRCGCTEDPDCVWHVGPTDSYCVNPSYDACPDLDIAFVLDGSGSMSRSFGKHAHGYYGLMEILRDWMKAVPLTGDDHTAGAGISSKGAGMRMTFIQFSKADATPEENYPTNCAIGHCTSGLLSGSRDELNGDLDWQEDNYQGLWTYLHGALQDVADNKFSASQSPSWRVRVVIIIADGGLMDYDGDACCEWMCGDPLCEDRMWNPAYPERLTAAQTSLRALSASVFGVVIRRFDKATFQDDNAAAKLMPLVTSPTTHFMNVQLENLQDDVLAQLCDASSTFGSVIMKTGTSTSCASLNEDDCNSNTACLWGSGTGLCEASVCSTHCDTARCATDSLCAWVGNSCEPKPAECSGNQAQCQADPACLWDAMWMKGACTKNPCVLIDSQNSCISHLEVIPLCNANPYYSCTIETCSYTADGCAVKTCLEDDATRCAQHSACEWVNVPIGGMQCAAKQCLFTQELDCTAHQDCKWNGDVCAVSVCGAYRNERDCGSTQDSVTCHWNLDAAACVEMPCALLEQVPCPASPSCMWDAGQLQCVAKTCAVYDTKCSCDSDPDCAWHHGPTSYCSDVRYITCPDLDIAFVLDGSGSMQRRFGKHAHGYYGLMEILRDWMKAVPLTGDDHHEGAGVSRESGFRMTFIQFSKANAKPEENHPTDCAIGRCTSGLLSGRRSELNGDLDWQEINYQGLWTYLHDALQDVADHTFSASQSPSWRVRAVIIIAGGGLMDYDGDACCADSCGEVRCMDNMWRNVYGTQLSTALQGVRDWSVLVFGVVIRRFPQKTFQDINAEAKLQFNLIPEDRLVSVHLDDLNDQVLTQLCDRNSVFGKALATAAPSCAEEMMQDRCTADPVCTWESGACKDSACYAYCDEGSCTSAACSWAGGMCRKGGCAGHVAEAECKADSTCLWNSVWAKDLCVENPCRDASDADACALVAVTMPECVSPIPDFCKLGVCHFSGTGCEVSPCLEDDQGRCNNDAFCQWKDGAVVSPTMSPSVLSRFCTPKLCSFNSQAACMASAVCKWEADQCNTLPCAQHSTLEDCKRDGACAWDSSSYPYVCTEHMCTKHSSVIPCDADEGCMWETDTCLPQTCSKYTSRCDGCDEAGECAWHHGQGTGQCVETMYSTCPDLDIAFVLDGSGSMSRSFGKHAHGYYGLMEILRDWMKAVPLTGDDHTAGAGISSKGAGMRMTFIQFSKADATAAENHPTNCAIGRCTDGLLSGNRDELNGDLDWQEANYQGLWTYLHGALQDVADHTFSASQSPPWRVRVVIIIADGGLMDYDGDACCDGLCGEVRCMDPDWKASYPEALNLAVVQLRKSAVVMGVVIRRFALKTAGDHNAEARLLPLLTDPKSDHLMDVTLDSLESAVLSQICNNNTTVGRMVNARLTGCPQYLNEQDCNLDKTCAWGDTCLASHCSVWCAEADCIQDPLCEFSVSDGICRDLSLCEGLDQTACTGHPACLWSVAWGRDTCVNNPCLDKDEASCQMDGVSIPTPCSPPEANQDYCKLDVCMFTGGVCEVRACLHTTQDRCETESNCMWRPSRGPLPTGPPSLLLGFCTRTLCKYTSASACEADDACVWSAANGLCTMTECGGITSELDCSHNPNCRMDVAVQPERCTNEPCSKKLDSQACGDDINCMWQDSCVPKKCEDYSGQCDCQNDPDCVWFYDPMQTPQSLCMGKDYITCPDLDIAFVLDGSGSMQRRFGKHAHGYYGLMEILRDWMKAVPLTGENHAVGATTSKQVGMRMTFIQFSKADATAAENHPTNCNIGECTSGLLSGSRDELNGDLDWQEANYQGLWTYLHGALLDVADHTFSASQSPSWRVRVVIIIADGRLTDYAGAGCIGCGLNVGLDTNWKIGYRDLLLIGAENLRAAGVLVFGVAIRRYAERTLTDGQAEVDLSAAVAQKVVAVALDDLRGDVLDVLCESSSTFGSMLAKQLPTCEDNSQSLCSTDARCMWTGIECIKSACYDFCPGEACSANPRCVKGTFCTPMPQTPSPPTSAPRTASPHTGAPVTASPPSRPPATPAPPTSSPPSPAPLTWPPHTFVPTPVPTRHLDVDECKDPSTLRICEDVGQKCVDPDRQLDGSWKCVCLLPNNQLVEGVRAPADCSFDECSLYSPVCVSVGQQCVDVDTNKPGSWRCECLSPSVGSSVEQGPAVCRDPPLICETAGPVCHGAGQSCLSEGQVFVCECISPAKGTPGQNMPSSDCALDECLVSCPTCAQTNKTDNNNICAAAGQSCTDPNTGHLSLGDWLCTCQNPLSGSRIRAPAICELNECTAACPTCADNGNGNGNICEINGQACVEKSLTSTSDWECHCVGYRGIGMAFASPASCCFDECRTHGHICVQAGQSCVDADPCTPNNWACECAAPSASSWVGGVAVCEVDECTLEDVNQVCESTSQSCVDPDIRVRGNWECRCGAGAALQRPVTECWYDECEQSCPTCAITGPGSVRSNVCTEAGQLCEDPQPTHTNLGDWICKCPPPSTKTAVTTSVIVCTDGLDECEERSAAVQCQHKPRYTKDGCLCMCGWTSDEFKQTEPCNEGCCNPLHEPSSWCLVDTNDAYNQAKPHCIFAAPKQFCVSAGQVPADGGRALRDPIPGTPNGQTNVCTDVGQKCVDPDKLTDDDWWCECVLPRTGPHGMQSTTVCEDDECVTYGAVCSAVGQRCVDPDKMVTGNWVCECVVGPATQGQQGVAVCTVDECVEICPTCATDNGTTACAEVGQMCRDPNTAGTSLRDWMCICAPPSLGSAVEGPVARCVLDECVQTCPTCANGACETAMQACEDPDQSVANNWLCVCRPPSRTTAVGNRATCVLNECEDKNCMLGQMCYDPDLTKSDDWRCECGYPTLGFAMMANATCEEDECKSHAEVCMDAGQMCRDTDKLTFGNWICECILPDQGLPGAQKPAECKPTAECENNYVCSGVGQHCVDPDDTVVDDWECHCIQPYTGANIVKGPAVCIIDECIALCPSCARQTATTVSVCDLYHQDCVDTDTQTLSSWECRCPAPAKGIGSTKAAICVLDECAVSCQTCENGRECMSGGQTCVDTNTDVRSLRDWVCMCASPSTDQKTAGVVPVCLFDECSVPMSQDVCGVAGQTCIDLDHSTVGSWECACPAPYSGSAAQAVAGSCTLNECTTKCAGCADRDDGAGNACAREDHTCIDPDHHTDGDWYCECTVGTGVAVGKAVVLCVLDECAVACPTCADTGGGNVCTKEGQICTDVNTAADSKGDWECGCPTPFEEIKNKAGLAVCSVDECLEMLGGKMNGQVCLDNGQLCHDSHLDSLNDFDCICPPPKHGTKTAGLALCSTDECLLHEDVCQGANQTCLDQDVFVENNWVCICKAPSKSTQLMGRAECEIDECDANRLTCEGATPPQVCVDVDKMRTDNWECRCQVPAVGTAVAEEATCMLDECKVSCATCENGVCKAKEQTCEDPNPLFGILNDWVCKCPPPSLMKAIGGVATACPVDECLLHGYVCQADHQTCVDPDKAETSRGDWVCHCTSPYAGVAIAGVAECTVDECVKHGHVCTGEGQTCKDPDQSANSIGDWVCSCQPPAPQTAVAQAAVCMHVGECNDPVVAGVCESKGQSCEDPDITVLGDWRCLCTLPSHGVSQTAGAATCVLDECSNICGSCSNGACTAVNQQCVDENTSPVTGLHSWECRCQTPFTGSKVAGVATCVTNECETHGSTCTSAEQICMDPSWATTGDWRCTCASPSVGVATAGVAWCYVDECAFHGKTCSDVGQLCLDPDWSAQSLGDWNCTCVSPRRGTQQGASVPMCEFDECDIYGYICAAAGQTCVDTETLFEGYWTCSCPEPNEKVQRERAPAMCVLDECSVKTDYSAVASLNRESYCEMKGQVCTDPNMNASSQYDWFCTCPPPSNAISITHPGICLVDECTEPNKEGVCAAGGQRCNDPNWSHSGDWTCECVSPQVGSGAQVAALCQLDECKTNGYACLSEGQVCVDLDLTKPGTWGCNCLPQSGVTSTQMMGANTDCNEPSSECKIDAIRSQCTNVNQGCYDPDLTVHNDWRCECLVPAVGPGAQGGPSLCFLDECSQDCMTCGKMTCAAAGQRCEDPNTDAGSLGDWICLCISPASGSQEASVAFCTLDECRSTCDGCPSDICMASGTQCLDPNTDARSVSDWECVCRTGKGRSTLGAPLCVLDECELNAGLCSDGQKCSDPDTRADSQGDWMCTCLFPTSGSAVATAAVCSVNECALEEHYTECHSKGQICIDPNPEPSRLNDWECHCPTGAGYSVLSVAVCVLDECIEQCPTCADTGGGNVCTKEGQICTDANTSPESVRDWTCRCASGSYALAGVAACDLDECTEVSNFGARTCRDEQRFSVDGCRCQCGWTADPRDFPWAGGPGIMVGCDAGCCNPNLAAAGEWCLLDPAQDTTLCRDLVQQGHLMQTCAAAKGSVPVSNVCTQAGQVCVDPDTSVQSLGDWRCECALPNIGSSSPRKAAACFVDECVLDGAGVCAAAGQLCRDLDKATHGTWECLCPPYASGSSVGQVATCKYQGKCETEADVCTQVGQTCYPDEVRLQGWMCACVSPSTGVPVAGAPASCELNECTAQCSTCADKGFGNVCTAAGQQCIDTSLSPADLGDWQCQCVGGQVGEAVAKPAACGVDECLLNRGSLTSICGAVRQACEDPNTLVAGDWQCTCVWPQLGRATGKPATCVLDECMDPAVSTVCTTNGQTCRDPNTDTHSTGDWTCSCPSVDGRKAVANPANCLLPPSAWCTGDICSEHGQACLQGSIGEPGECACISPQTGSSKHGAVASCILDECRAACPTCADRGTGNICNQAGQECIEGSTHPVMGLADWMCKCQGSDTFARTAVALCTHNECNEDGPAKVCSAAWQKCTDTSLESFGDWKCECYAPSTGSRVGGAAACTLDECSLYGSVCAAVGQTCRDTSATAMGDWACHCVQPAFGWAVAKAAFCDYTGECANSSIAAVCADAGQTCMDVNPAVDGNWACHCTPPLHGPLAVMEVATCALDECEARCPSCATWPRSLTHMCTAAGQDCVDPDTSPSSIADWKCTCRSPATGEMLTAPASCSLDECSIIANQAVCAGVLDVYDNKVQHCVDLDSTTAGDWTCECLPPYHGIPARREPALCLLDECTSSTGQNRLKGNEVCSKAGQLCVDPQQGVGSHQKNWMCQCSYPDGAASVGRPATSCLTTTLCAQFGSVCGDSQTCISVGDTWRCVCLEPLVGEAIGASATCVLDECSAECTTCAQQGSTHVCTEAKQKCVDHDKSPDSRSDWSCVCEEGHGEAALHKAVCVVDECALNGLTCEGMRQTCTDKNTAATSRGDWVCRCAEPASGEAVAGPASCLIDECSIYGTACTEVGQVCIDHNTAPASKNDWTCNCPAPASGVMYAGPAVCVYKGGCIDDANREVCASAGQRCVPGVDVTDTAAFRCACMPPFRGEEGVRMAAQCLIDECIDICATCARTDVSEENECTASGQDCNDPNLSALSLHDWVCMCREPSASTAIASPVETCVVDECLSVTMTGARKCEHFRRFTTDGCECACGWFIGSVGSGPGTTEPCNAACCNPTHAADGDWCIVADSDFNRGSATCRALITAAKTCADPRAPAPAGAPMPTLTNVCEDVGQHCVDPNVDPSMQGDWECHCSDSDMYHILAPAKCSMCFAFLFI